MKSKKNLIYLFLARLFFKEKKSRYCHHSGVGVGGGVVVVVVVVVVIIVTNLNLGFNFVSVEANLMKLLYTCSPSQELQSDQVP